MAERNAYSALEWEQLTYLRRIPLSGHLDRRGRRRHTLRPHPDYLKDDVAKVMTNWCAPLPQGDAELCVRGFRSPVGRNSEAY
jgi:hypothetical protein